jgi:hypothetical protein
MLKSYKMLKILIMLIKLRTTRKWMNIYKNTITKKIKKKKTWKILTAKTNKKANCKILKLKKKIWVKCEEMLSKTNNRRAANKNTKL